MDHRKRCPARVNPRENRCICDLLEAEEDDGVKIGIGAAVNRLRFYLNNECGPISAKGMTAGPVCLDECVALVAGEKP